MKECGIHVVDSPAQIGKKLLKYSLTKKMKLLDNKIAIITGASRGIGKGIVRSFIDQGAQ